MIAVRIILDPLDEVVQIVDLHTGHCYGGMAYVECQDKIDIMGFDIGPDFRNRGLGTQLMNFIFDYFKGKDIKLGVLNQNHAAQRFYERMGFKFLRGLRTADHGAFYMLKENK
jgi:ribosomal protein S18 acetylase RimI-like enzyme